MSRTTASAVPEGWRVAPLKRALRGVNQGWSPQCENRAAEPAEWGVLKVGCVNGLAFDPTENKALPPELEPDLNFAIHKGDLLVSRANTRELVGMAAIVEHDHPNLLLCDKLYRLQLRSEWAVPTFVVHALRSEPARHQIELGASGASSSMQNISQDVLRELSMAFPPVKEQTAIANFLDEKTARIDALIAEKERLVGSLAAYLQTHCSWALTHGLDARVALMTSPYPELGEVPAHWKVVRLKFLGEVRSGIAKGKDNNGKATVSMPYLRVANVQAGYVDLGDVAEIEVPADEVSRYLLQKGDVLMNEGGDNDKLGRGAVWQEQVAPCIHQNHVFAVRLEDPADAEWVSRYTATDAARAYFFLRSKQSTNLASINQSNVRELPVPMPPRAERISILADVGRVESAVTELATHATGHIARLREYRSSLISAAVTGQLDLGICEPMGAV